MKQKSNLHIGKGSFCKMCNYYGESTVQLSKYWSINSIKLAHLLKRRVFFLKCMSKNIINNHLSGELKGIYPIYSHIHPYFRKADRIITEFINLKPTD